MLEHQLTIRVGYHETDGQGRVHHAQYLNYLEQARVEMLRANGYSYRELEQSGLMLVVAKMELRYWMPAQFDDLLTVCTRVEQAKGARIKHSYRIFIDERLLVQATSEIACIDREGRVRRLPKYLEMQ